MVPTYVRPLPVMVRGEGVYLWDMENRRYLDFTAGIAVTSLGHSDPGVTQEIVKQVRVWTLGVVYTRPAWLIGSSVTG